jgi:DNA repair protein RadC
MRKALLKNATALICAHNHPSGSLEPSEADRLITRQLIQASELLGIRMLDHIIIGGPSEYFSFSENGLMNPGRPGKND